jgi:hypothetical protein
MHAYVAHGSTSALQQHSRTPRDAPRERPVRRVAGGCTDPGSLCPSWRWPHLQRGQVAPLVTREALLGHELGRPAEQVHARALPEAQQVAHAARAARPGRQVGARALPAAAPGLVQTKRLTLWPR